MCLKQRISAVMDPRQSLIQWFHHFAFWIQALEQVRRQDAILFTKPSRALGASKEPAKPYVYVNEEKFCALLHGFLLRLRVRTDTGLFSASLSTSHQGKPSNLSGEDCRPSWKTFLRIRVFCTSNGRKMAGRV